MTGVDNATDEDDVEEREMKVQIPADQHAALWKLKYLRGQPLKDSVAQAVDLYLNVLAGNDVDVDKVRSEFNQGNYPRGRNNPQATLTEDDVLDIINRLKAGDDPPRIAQDYPVTKSTIKSIQQGLTWTHVNGNPEGDTS